MKKYLLLILSLAITSSIFCQKKPLKGSELIIRDSTLLQLIAEHSGNGSGVTPNSNLWEWYPTGLYYRGYTTKQSFLSFYTGTENPTGTTRLNLNAIFYATTLNATANTQDAVTGNSESGRGLYCYSTSGIGGVSNIGASNTSHIWEFQKNNAALSYIANNGEFVQKDTSLRNLILKLGKGEITPGCLSGLSKIFIFASPDATGQKSDTISLSASPESQPYFVTVATTVANVTAGNVLTLVPAAGANKIINVKKIWFYTHSGTAFSAPAGSAILYLGTVSVATYTDANLGLDQANETYNVKAPMDAFSLATGYDITNKAVTFDFATHSGGTSKVGWFKIEYTILTKP
jgi:hypothetical protein